MKLLFGLLFCFMLLEYSEQVCTTCPCTECPSGSSCSIHWLGSFPFISCDGLCMTCARYIVNPCTNCPSGTFCYEGVETSPNIQCLGCDTYPNFCAAPYTYSNPPSEKLVSLASNSKAFQQLPLLKKP